MGARFLVVCLNPTLQNTYIIDSLRAGQVNRVIDHRLDASGKGVNVTRVLTQLGEDAVHLTQGGGRHLELFRTLCEADRVALEVVEGDVEIRHCHTLLGQADRTMTEIVEPGQVVPDGMETKLINTYRTLLGDAHTVVITGSKAPGFTDTLYPAMVGEARRAGVRTILDIRGDELVAALLERPTLVKINLSEFSQTFRGVEMPEETAMADVPAELLRLITTVSCESGAEMVVSNGRRPLLYADGNTLETVEPRRVEPVNAIGSGDALTAGIAAGLYRGTSLPEAIELGLDCAAKNLARLKPGSIGDER